MKNYRWVTIGCGDIAHQFAQAMRQEGRTLYGVANRTYEKAAAFAEEYGIPVTAWSAFEYLSLPAATLNGVAYPAGYYETLCVTLKRL